MIASHHSRALHGIGNRAAGRFVATERLELRRTQDFRPARHRDDRGELGPHSSGPADIRLLVADVAAVMKRRIDSVEPFDLAVLVDFHRSCFSQIAESAGGPHPIKLIASPAAMPVLKANGMEPS